MDIYKMSKTGLDPPTLVQKKKQIITIQIGSGIGHEQDNLCFLSYF